MHAIATVPAANPMTDLVGGLALGSIYALIAVGVALVYRTTGVVNFAQGELVAIGAYAYVLASFWTGSPLLTMFAALLGGVIAGMIFFVVVHVLLRGRDELRLVVGTIALLTLIQGGARLIATDRPYRAETWLFADSTIHFAGAVLPANSLVIIAVLLFTALALFLWFSFTTVGKAMAAVAEDPVRSALAGIPVRTMLLISWATAGAMAAMAGVLISPVTGAFPEMGAQVFLAAVVGAVVGGLDSIVGALVGGLLVGVVQTYAVIAVGGAYRDVIVFVLLLLFLLVRPAGLLGSRSARRV
jgi:branched-chain amino acid transport system permease protein